MNKSILFYLFLFATVSLQSIDIIKIRDLYYKASVNKSDAETFFETIHSTPKIDKFLLAGYQGMSHMIKANYAFNPYNKLSYFIKGKNLLDEAITADPKNIELRFLRFSVQTNAPAFLGYGGKVNEDKKEIMLAYHHLVDEDLKARIKKFMNESSSVSKTERQVFI
jgi:hypothetical protein